MDHACNKCGHSVADGRPFCSQCGAPQIRVAMPEGAAPAVAGTVFSPPLPIFSSDPSSVPLPHAPSLSAEIEWPTAMRVCAVAALIAALVMTLGLVIPLVAVLGAGSLAVTLYRQRNPAWTVNARSGAKLGAVCGILFFGTAAVFEIVTVRLLHTGGQVRQKVLDALQQAASRSNDPQVQAAFDQLKTPEGIALMLVFGMVLLFLLSIAAGSLAGALTGSFLGRRNRP
jgi:hypothetical protein